MDQGYPKNHYFIRFSDQIFILGKKMSVENTFFIDFVKKCWNNWSKDIRPQITGAQFDTCDK